jgi:cytoskeletal protein RodZ
MKPLPKPALSTGSIIMNTAIERLNSPIAVVVVLVLFLAIDGFLLYRYQQTLHSTENEAANTSLEETSAPAEDESSAAEETTTSREEEQTKNEPSQNEPSQNVPPQDLPDQYEPDQYVPNQLPS